MFSVSEIITAGSDLVGWRQSANALWASLTDGLKTSTSGYYVNDLPGVDFDVINYALSDDYASVNDYLQTVHESQIVDLVEGFVSKSKSILGSRSVLNNFDVSNGVADYTDLATKNARFVGWLITPRSSNNLRTEITKLGLQLSASQSLKIYLYETSQQSAIHTETVSYTTPLSLAWTSVSGWTCDFRGDLGTRQQYLLGYYEYDPNNVVTGQLTGSAVEYDFDCGCDNSPRKVFGEYVWIQPIEIPNDKLNYSGGEYKLPNINDLTSYYCDESRGLFAKINVTCDITDVLIDNIDVFGKAMQYSVAVRILDDYLASKRLNAVVDAKRYREFAENKRNMYWSFLNGWIDTTGFRHRGLIEDLVIDFSRIDDVCLPCDNRQLRIGLVGR